VPGYALGARPGTSHFFLKRLRRTAWDSATAPLIEISLDGPFRGLYDIH